MKRHDQKRLGKEQVYFRVRHPSHDPSLKKVRTGAPGLLLARSLHVDPSFSLLSYNTQDLLLRGGSTIKSWALSMSTINQDNALEANPMEPFFPQLRFLLLRCS